MRNLFIAALFLGMAGGVCVGQKPKTQEDCSKRSKDAVQFSRCMDSIGLTSPLKIFCYAGTGSHCTEAQAEHYNDVTALAPNSTVVGIRDHKPIYASPKPQPAPLKCGKWEHIDDSLTHLCGAVDQAERKKYLACSDYPKSVCLPIMHKVTEKEFQLQMEMNESLRRELRDLRLALAANNERLHKLEHPPCPNSLGEGPNCPL